MSLGSRSLAPQGACSEVFAHRNLRWEAPLARWARALDMLKAVMALPSCKMQDSGHLESIAVRSPRTELGVWDESWLVYLHRCIPLSDSSTLSEGNCYKEILDCTSAYVSCRLSTNLRDSRISISIRRLQGTRVAWPAGRTHTDGRPTRRVPRGSMHTHRATLRWDVQRLEDADGSIRTVSVLTQLGKMR